MDARLHCRATLSNKISIVDFSLRWIGRLARVLASLNLGIEILGLDCEEQVQPEPNEAGYGHDYEHETVAMGPSAGGSAIGRGGGLCVVYQAGKQAGEEEGAEREVEDEDVVDKAVVLEAEELGGRRHGDGQADTIAEADEDRADVEGAGQGQGHYDEPGGHHHLGCRVPQRPGRPDFLQDKNVRTCLVK